MQGSQNQHHPASWAANPPVQQVFFQQKWGREAPAWFLSSPLHQPSLQPSRTVLFVGPWLDNKRTSTPLPCTHLLLLP